MTTDLLATARALSDSELLARVGSWAGREREATAEVVAHVAELEVRKLHLRDGYGSLFVYCRDALRLSEAEAYNRIEAARAARRFPVILELMQDGAINLTTVRLLGRHLTDENHRQVLESARGKKKAEIEEIMVALWPRPDVPDTVRKLPPPRGFGAHSGASAGGYPSRGGGEHPGNGFGALPGNDAAERPGNGFGTYPVPGNVFHPGSGADATGGGPSSRPSWLVPGDGSHIVGAHSSSSGAGGDQNGHGSPPGQWEFIPPGATGRLDVASAEVAGRAAALDVAGAGAAGGTAAASAGGNAGSAGGSAAGTSGGSGEEGTWVWRGSGAAPAGGAGTVGGARTTSGAGITSSGQPPYGSPPAPGVVPLSPERFKVQFTIGVQTLEKMRLAQDMLRHAIPSGDQAAIFDRALTVLLSELARKKFAATEKPRPATAPATSGSRHVPAEVRRAVWQRDLGRCAFTSAEGRRCSERAFLEFHHDEPYAIGGEATVANIQLRCRQHNGFESQLVFGATAGGGNSFRNESRPGASGGPANGVPHGVAADPSRGSPAVTACDSKVEGWSIGLWRLDGQKLSRTGRAGRQAGSIGRRLLGCWRNASAFPRLAYARHGGSPLRLTDHAVGMVPAGWQKGRRVREAGRSAGALVVRLVPWATRLSAGQAGR